MLATSTSTLILQTVMEEGHNTTSAATLLVV